MIEGPVHRDHPTNKPSKESVIDPRNEGISFFMVMHQPDIERVVILKRSSGAGPDYVLTKGLLLDRISPNAFVLLRLIGLSHGLTEGGSFISILKAPTGTRSQTIRTFLCLVGLGEVPTLEGILSRLW